MIDDNVCNWENFYKFLNFNELFAIKELKRKPSLRNMIFPLHITWKLYYQQMLLLVLAFCS